MSKSKWTYEEISRYYASHCQQCNGAGKVLLDGIWWTCPCQREAKIRYYFENIPVEPPSLKYKGWSDFNGIVPKKGRVVSVDLINNAKSLAMQYCFGTNDPNVVKGDFAQVQSNRKIYSQVLERLEDGHNLVITGNGTSGRSLLATLVVKEIIYAIYLFNKWDINFRWVSASDVYAATFWGDGSTETSVIDASLLYDLSEANFLIIDDLFIEKGGHTRAADVVELNKLFSGRVREHKPTILVGGSDLASLVGPTALDDYIQENIRSKMSHVWGTALWDLVKGDNTTVINLIKNKKRNNV